MRSTFYLTTSALVAFASAQLSSKCNPTVNETGSCPDNPAISASFETDFKAGKEAVKGWDIENWSVQNYAPNYVAEGVELTVANKKDVPVLRTQGYFLFGKIEVRMKAAPGAGIVSSVVLASADLDEVDWEWLGGFPDKVQTNYFGKGNATTFDRVTEVPVKNQEFHTYALDWTKEKLDWIIDDKVVRTLKYEDAVGGKNYPQTPCTLGFGPWAAGDSENEGTSQWAGGKVDWSKGPYSQTIEWVKITNYSPGSAYKWKDQSGSWESIEVLDAGNKEGAPVNTETATPSAATSVATEGIGSHPTITSAAEGDKPTETGKEGEQPGETNSPGYGEKPTEAPSTSCSEGEKPTAPPTPEEPCDCDTETTTVTGYPPKSTTEAPPSPPETTEVSPPPPQTTETSSCTTSTSVPPPPPPPETEVSPPPPQTTPEVPPPPPETSAPPPPPETTAPPPPPETTAPPPPPETTAPPPPPETTVPPPPPETTAPPPPPETTAKVPPPPATNETSSCTTSTSVPPPPPATGGSTSCTTSTSITITVPNPPSTTEVSPPPPTETPQTTLETSATPPPYPTIKTDTSSPPAPSAPTGAVPTGGNTTSPPVPEFSGAATHNTAGALFGLVGAVMLMAF